MKEQNPMIIGGKVLQMTEENFELIKKRIDQVIYAEWAAVGAMGCSGTARVVIMEGEDLIEYVASAGKLYDAIYDLINDHSDKRWMAGMIPVGVVLDLQNGPMLTKKMLLNTSSLPMGALVTMRGKISRLSSFAMTVLIALSSGREERIIA